MKKEKIGLTLIVVACLSVVFFEPSQFETNIKHLRWFYGSYSLMFIGICLLLSGIISTIKSFEKHIEKIYKNKIETIERMSNVRKKTNQK